MISSADFNSSLPRVAIGASAPLIAPEEEASTVELGEADDVVSADPLTVSVQISWPPTINFMAVSVHFLATADSHAR
jgi:hypothetical protein